MYVYVYVYVCVCVRMRVPGRVGAVRENHKYCATKGSKMATESMLIDESRERCNGQEQAAVDVWIAKSGSTCVRDWRGAGF